MAYWKNIIGFPEYEIDTLGRVWSWNRLKYLKPRVSMGYNRVRLYINGKGYNKFVHRLVLEAFIGKCPKGMETCHNNRDKLDNRLENLRWDTRQANMKDAIKHGTHACLRQGELHNSHRLKEQDVKMIVYLWGTGKFTQQEIGNIYNIGGGHVNQIVKKKIWKYLWEK